MTNANHSDEITAGHPTSKGESAKPDFGPYFGEVVLHWRCLEREKYEHGRGWYAFMIAVGVCLLAYAVYTANFLFALIIVMAALIIYVSIAYEPKEVDCAITEDGILFGKTFFPFREIRFFWFYYDPPYSRSLYLETSSTLTPRVRIDLVSQNPNQIRAILSRYVREDLTETEEPLTDSLSRLFRI